MMHRNVENIIYWKNDIVFFQLRRFMYMLLYQMLMTYAYFQFYNNFFLRFILRFFNNFQVRFFLSSRLIFCFTLILKLVIIKIGNTE